MKMTLKHVAVINFHHILFIFLCLQPALHIVMSSSYDISKPGCVNKCGDVSIPYPFGIGDKNCYFDDEFIITCNETFNPPKPFFGGYDLLDIDLSGQFQTNVFVASDCYDQNGIEESEIRVSSTLTRFTFSDTRNKLVAIGCDTLAYIIGDNYRSGCVSSCYNITFVKSESCTGRGCCKTSIPTGLRKYNVELSSSGGSRSSIWGINPCSYAFLVEENWFNFSILDLKNNRNRSKVPVVIDWFVGNETCEEAKMKGTSACGAYSYCYDVSNGNLLNGNGYHCNCLNGFEGNPYISNGCQDIDECRDDTLNNCLQGRCKNTMGGFNCFCPQGSHGDGKRENGRGCEKITNDTTLGMKITLGIGISILFLLVISSWLYWGFKKKKLMEMKEKFYRQNGGLMLEKIMKEQQDNDLNVKIFTDEELKRATNNYDESQIIGRGGFGTVYKGILLGKTAVAIKKSKIVDQSQTEQFVNEVAVLSQIRHRNVVKLLGCCLENEVPLLVYEFITNGTLFQHLHDEDHVSLLSWETRLRIAAEIATSLSYLHYEASIPIIHRDVKSMNILLDDNYTAKVADFGASRLVPLDQTQLSTLVQGTLGYLDPEYFHTSQLTEKSDVYSFGVLLAELLTGKKALSFDRPKEEMSLAAYFISAMKEDRVFQIFEEHLVIQASVEHLEQVAELTKRCLKVKGEKRPTMKEVVIILDGLRSSVKLPSVFDIEANREENVYLLAEAKNSYTGTDVGGNDSLIDLVPSYSGR